MSVEPGLVDANVLVYALDADAPNHAVSRVLLEAARAGAASLLRDPANTLRILFDRHQCTTRAEPAHARGGAHRHVRARRFSSCVADSGLHGRRIAGLLRPPPGIPGWPQWASTLVGPV